jgi:hypothetical protein
VKAAPDTVVTVFEPPSVRQISTNFSRQGHVVHQLYMTLPCLPYPIKAAFAVMKARSQQGNCVSFGLRFFPSVYVRQQGVGENKERSQLSPKFQRR